MENWPTAGIFNQQSWAQNTLDTLEKWKPEQMKAGAGYYRDSGKFVVHLTHNDMDGPKDYVTLDPQEIETLTKFINARQNGGDKPLKRLLDSGAERLKAAQNYIAEEKARQTQTAAPQAPRVKLS